MPKGQRVPIIKPGTFSFIAAADRMRSTYDCYNEQILSHSLPVDFDFIGESITQNWDLQVYFRSPGQFIINRGIGGDITDTMFLRFPADVIQLKPKYVHILGGTNNTWRQDAVEMNQRRTPEQIYYEVLRDFTMMVQLSKKNGIMPIVGSCLPVGRNIPCYDFRIVASCTNYSTETRNELLVASNNALKKMAEYEKAIYIDYHAYLVGPDGKTLRPELADDSLHPNVLGYNIMADVLRRSLSVYGIVI